MAIQKDSPLSGFTLSIVLGLSFGMVQAGVPALTPGALVEPGGVEIPVRISVLGPEDPDDIVNVDAALVAANQILLPANVQLAVRGIETGVEIGDGDRLLGEAEHDEALRRALRPIELPPASNGDNGDGSWSKGKHGPGRAVTIFIADDIRTEQPERVFWNHSFLPVTFLELGDPPEQGGRTLARQLGMAAGLPDSGDSGNLMFPDGTGTNLDDPDQTGPILELSTRIGMVRSPLAEGFAPDVLASLRCPPWQGALFFPELIGSAADAR